MIIVLIVCSRTIRQHIRLKAENEGCYLSVCAVVSIPVNEELKGVCVVEVEDYNRRVERRVFYRKEVFLFFKPRGF